MNTTQIDENVIEEVTTVVKRIDRTQLIAKKASLQKILERVQSELADIETQLERFQ